MKVFTERDPRLPAYWFRADRDEERRQLALMRSQERRALRVGFVIRPRNNSGDQGAGNG